MASCRMGVTALGWADRLVRMTTTSRLLLSACFAGAALALNGMGVIAQAAPAPRVLTVTKSMAIKVLTPGNQVGAWSTSQEFTVQCPRPNDRSLAPGIIFATNPLAAMSFGPQVLGGSVVGRAGVSRTRLQLLCLRNGRIVSRDVQGRIVPGSSSDSGRVTVRASCPRGFVPVAAPLSQDYAPGFGRFISRPDGARGWLVQVEDVPDGLIAINNPGAFARVNCVKAAASSTVAKRAVLLPNGTAAMTLTCARGRALGGGVELGTYTRYPTRGDWATPIVAQAQFTGTRAMRFLFRLPPGVSAPADRAVDVTAHVVCGTPIA